MFQSVRDFGNVTQRLLIPAGTLLSGLALPCSARRWLATAKDISMVIGWRAWDTGPALCVRCPKCLNMSEILNYLHISEYCVLLYLLDVTGHSKGQYLPAPFSPWIQPLTLKKWLVKLKNASKVIFWKYAFLFAVSRLRSDGRWRNGIMTFICSNLYCLYSFLTFEWRYIWVHFFGLFFTSASGTDGSYGKY